MNEEQLRLFKILFDNLSINTIENLYKEILERFPHERTFITNGSGSLNKYYPETSINIKKEKKLNKILDFISENYDIFPEINEIIEPGRFKYDYHMEMLNNNGNIGVDKNNTNCPHCGKTVKEKLN